MIVSISGQNVTYPDFSSGGCQAWDLGYYPGYCDGSKGPPSSWCRKQWCYVDPCNCKLTSKISTYFGQADINATPISYSYATCGETPAAPAACGTKVFEEKCNALADCQWQVSEETMDGICRDKLITCDAKSEPLGKKAPDNSTTANSTTANSTTANSTTATTTVVTELREPASAGSWKIAVFDVEGFETGGSVWIGAGDLHEAKMIAGTLERALLEEGRVSGTVLLDSPLVNDYPRGTGVSATSKIYFDCSAGWKDWKFGWSEQKKKYCCNKEGKSCEAWSPTPELKVERGMENCPCVAVSIGVREQSGIALVIAGKNVTYPDDLVSGTCQAWDADLYPGECDGTKDPAPDWCNKRWCFVDPCSCNQTTVMSSHFGPEVLKGSNPLQFSYTTCGETDTFSDANTCGRLLDPEGCEETENCKWEVWGDLMEFQVCLNKRVSCATPPPTPPPTPADPNVALRQEATKLLEAVSAGASQVKVDDTSSFSVGQQVVIEFSMLMERRTISSITSLNATGEGSALLSQSGRAAGFISFNKPLVNSYPAGTSITGPLDLSSGHAACPCISLDVGSRNSSTGTMVTVGERNIIYAGNLNSGGCQAWDEGLYPGSCDSAEPEAWCSKKWCFVDPCQCSIARQISTYFGNTVSYKGNAPYYSYATCDARDLFSGSTSIQCGMVQEQMKCLALPACKWEDNVCQDQGLQCKSEAAALEITEDKPSKSIVRKHRV